jgi:hypothetical protein
MNFRTLAAAACFSLATATSSFAATFTVGGDEFDITTIFRSFNDNQALLEAQIWWGGAIIASDFASVVGDLFGPIDPSFNGPHFAISEEPLLVFGELVVKVVVFNGLGEVEQSNRVTTNNRTYAVASPISAVPLPTGGLLLLSGVAGFAGLKRRSSRAA